MCWAHVVVFKYKSRTEPIVVNVYGFETEKEARAAQRRARQEAIDLRVADRVIANRVRPVLNFDDQELLDLSEGA